MNSRTFMNLLAKSRAVPTLALLLGFSVYSRAFAASRTVANPPPSPAAGATKAPNPSPTDHFITQPDVVYVALVPHRPKNADQLHVAVGTFESYELANAPAEMVLTLRDPLGTRREYVLAEHTTLNGKPLECTKESTLNGSRFCDAFPQYISPGKTRVAVLYWSQSFSGYKVLGTDEIAAF